MRDSEVFQVEIATCPLCKGDMADWDNLTEQMIAYLDHSMGEMASDCVACPKCRIYMLDDDALHRIEYHEMFYHKDAGGGVVVELSISESPDMANAVTHFYRWTNDGPVPEESFAGIDTQFAAIMGDFA